MTCIPDRFVDAAVEGVWGCRLSIARLETPADPPAIERFDPVGRPDAPWVYDCYAHVLFAQRLNEATKAIQGALADDDLAEAITTFEEHWSHLRPLRNLLQHPLSTDLDPDALRIFHDRIEYRFKGRDPVWVFSLDELHEPVEALNDAIEATVQIHVTEEAGTEE